MSAIKLRFTVEELSNVMTQFDRVKILRSTTGSGGPYAEITNLSTRVVLVADQTLYEYIDSLGDTSYYYRFQYFHSVTLLEGSPSTPIQGSDTGGNYCSVQDLRDEGITTAMLSDARATKLIALCSKEIERYTGRWFEPRARTFRVKGRNSAALFLPQPIIRIDSVKLVSGRGSLLTTGDIDLTGILVFNRHLTEDMTNPDDRDCPRIEFEAYQSMSYPGQEFVFPWGSQIVEVQGLFGYTELHSGDSVGETSVGSQVPLCYGHTPDLIKQLCMLLVTSKIGTLGDPASRSDWMLSHRLKSEKTADQSYELFPVANDSQGAWTGNTEIDSIIAMYIAPPDMGAV